MGEAEAEELARVPVRAPLARLEGVEEVVVAADDEDDDDDEDGDEVQPSADCDVTIDKVLLIFIACCT